MDVMDAQTKNLNEFRSPVRVLAAFFQKSRDQWKQRCLDAKSDLKRFKVRVADVSKSRDAWREKAEASQSELHALQAQVQELQNQINGPHQPPPVTEQKMTPRPNADSSRRQSTSP